MTKERPLPTPRARLYNLTNKLYSLIFRMGESPQDAAEIEALAFRLIDIEAAEYFKRPTAQETRETLQSEKNKLNHAKACEAAKLAKANGANKGGRPRKVKP